MSRCFPFHPPEYKRKAKADDLDLLKKEKHREKKQKKEDKEKKDSKEKREKVRSDEKHKEKKDKKEKHRDKKKEKDRDKGNHKSGSFLPDEKRVVGLSGAHILTPSEKSQDKENERGANLADKRVAGLSAFCNGEQVSKNSNLPPDNKNNPLIVETKSSRNASELGQGNAHKERTIHQLPHKIVSTEGKDSEFSKLGRAIARPQVDGKERSKENTALPGRMDVQGVVEEAKPSGSALVPNSVGMVQNRVGVGQVVEKKVGHRVEGKEKIRDKEVDIRERDKQKGKDREKPIHKDKKREKEKKTEEKLKVACEEKHVEQSRIKDRGENHVLKSYVKDGFMKETSSAQIEGLQNTPKDGNCAAVAPLNNLGKRKKVGFNGVYDEQTTGPNKLAKTTASTLPQIDNGRILEPCQSSTILVDGKQRLPMNVKVDHTFAPDDTQRPPMNIRVDGKERKLNGTITQQVSGHPFQTTANTERKPDVPSKLPHPDSKYLSQVLAVPKLDDWSDLDDQEWLFKSSNCQTRKPEVDSCGINKTPQVWAKALWLEPVDVYALPYVIPY